jgi:hypothetical protein
MQLTDKIDDLIKWANHRIDFLENKIQKSDIDIWDRYYNRGYITSQKKYIDDLKNLKNIIIEIEKDDDDV